MDSDYVATSVRVVSQFGQPNPNQKGSDGKTECERKKDEIKRDER